MRLVAVVAAFALLPAAAADARRARTIGYAVKTAIPIGRPATPAPAPPAPSPPEAPPAETPPVTPPPVVYPKAVQVRAREFSLTLSTATVAAGPVRVEYSLVAAEDPHDLVIERGDTSHLFAEQGPGTVVARSLPLTEGTWRLYCSLPDHAALGMDVNLTVK